MATTTAPEGAAKRPALRLKLPERLPDFGRRGLFAFRILWFAVLALAVIGPLAGTWYRLSDASRNSPLVTGSRAGVALDEENLTRIRYPVGPDSRRLGIRPGDRIVAIDTIPVSAAVPLPGTPAAEGSKATEVDKALFGDLVYGTEDREVELRLRSPDGRERDVRIRTGERHLEAGAHALGVPRGLLSFADLLHLLTFPFLLASAWLLYRRKPYDVISSVVSLAILLTLATEQPSATFLELVAGVPTPAHRALYDLGNICLLAGILLFPDGRLRPRWVLAIAAALPLLLVLQGDLYRTVFMTMMAASVLTLVWRLRNAKPGDERQQLKWALFGFSGYAVFLAASLLADMAKPTSADLSRQLYLELGASLSFGLAFLLLQLGLFVALMRYRLYDAEAVITRSASVALITLAVAGVFAATMEAVKVVVQSAFGQSSTNTAAIVGAAVSTVLVNPIYEHVLRWTERRFHRKLVELRQDLPECLRDLRHVASLSELLGEVLDRIEAGVRPTRAAILVEGQPLDQRGSSRPEIREWLAREAPDPSCTTKFTPSDPLFPIRLPLSVEAGRCLGWILVGPRPDRSAINAGELDALGDVAPAVARAIWVVRTREERQREVAEALSELRRRIDSLDARLSIDQPRSGA